MEILAFASFAILIVGWLVAPSSRTTTIVAAETEERAAA